MTKEKIKQAFEKMEVPAPNQSRKEEALQHAMEAFRQENQFAQKKIQGFASEDRPTSKSKQKLNLLGGLMLHKTRYITLGLSLCLLFLIVGVYRYGEKAGGIQEKTTVSVIPQSREEIGTLSQQPVDDSVSEEISAAPEKPLPKKVARPLVKAKKKSLRSGFKKDAAGTVPSAAPMMVDHIAGGLSHTSDGDIPVEKENRDRFEKHLSNPVKVVSESPISTFSIDVDTASYSVVRRSLNNGVLPPKQAVRIEEMINYFNYAYPLPKERTIPFHVSTALYPTPWNQGTKLLHIGIKGYDLIPEKKPTVNLVFLLDVSGSMRSADKLPLLKNSLRMLLEKLHPGDKVSIVVYAGAAGVVLEPTAVKEKSKILAALENLRAGGSTAGGEGIRLAYDLAAANFDPQGVNRIILATDGDFNVGITNSEQLRGFIERKRKSGIFLSILGFGRGNYNDALMQKLAQNGNGNAAYIDNLNEARKVLVEETASTLFTIAKDVKIQIEFNPNKVAEYRLIGYESRMLKREDFKNDAVDAGDIGSGHTVTAIYEIVPVGSKAALTEEKRYGNSVDKRELRDQPFTQEFAFLKIRYKLPKEEKSKLLTKPITQKEEYKKIDDIPQEIRFAASVASFGQLLRGEPYLKDFSFDDVIKLGLPAKGGDEFGYRAEFLNLVRLAKTARTM